MSRVHVYPKGQEHLHQLENADCKCEPKALDEGLDNAGERALVFVHNKINPVPLINDKGFVDAQEYEAWRMMNRMENDGENYQRSSP